VETNYWMQSDSMQAGRHSHASADHRDAQEGNNLVYDPVHTICLSNFPPRN